MDRNGTPLFIKKKNQYVPNPRANTRDVVNYMRGNTTNNDAYNYLTNSYMNPNFLNHANNCRDCMQCFEKKALPSIPYMFPKSSDDPFEMGLGRWDLYNPTNQEQLVKNVCDLKKMKGSPTCMRVANKRRNVRKLRDANIGYELGVNPSLSYLNMNMLKRLARTYGISPTQRKSDLLKELSKIQNINLRQLIKDTKYNELQNIAKKNNIAANVKKIQLENKILRFLVTRDGGKIPGGPFDHIISYL